MPAQRSVAYYHARTALLDEAWAFIFGDNSYASLTPEAQFALFRSRVTNVVRAAGSIDEQASSSGSTGAQDSHATEGNGNS
jgi:hypothetical protein